MARDLDVSAETLRKKWVNQAEIDSGELVKPSGRKSFPRRTIV
jgi:transposase-like protein